VTCQRVSYKRGRRSLQDFWKSVHANKISGIRIGDLSYAKKAIELGQLKGNHFVITLRCDHALYCRRLGLTQAAETSRATRQIQSRKPWPC
jgi:hypothetical protein